jgi:hypothetical protein
MSLSAETIYERLIDEEDARACADIPDQACRETPRNFVLILAAQFCTKLGDAIASPKVVLAWVMGATGAPVVFTGLLVPLRESGSLVPQLVIAGWVRRFAIRKWFWVAGSIVQALCIGAMALVALTLEGATAGIVLLSLLLLFSLARGVCSVAAKDVIGKTIPRRRRGRLTGWAVSLAGLATLAIGLGLLVAAGRGSSRELDAPLLWAAALLWTAGALVFARIVEFGGETDGGGNAGRDALSDLPFRRFVLTRALLLCSALSAPYYVLLAREYVGATDDLLGLFLFAAGLASLVSGPVWGRFADHSSRAVMVSAATISGGIGIVVYFVIALAPAIAAQHWFLPSAYFVLSVAHDGVRIGRKTYVIDLAGGNKRTDYVAVSNSVIGVVLLLAGLSGALSTVLSLAQIVLLLSLFGLAGALLGTRLKPV